MQIFKACLECSGLAKVQLLVLLTLWGVLVECVSILGRSHRREHVNCKVDIKRASWPLNDL